MKVSNYHHHELEVDGEVIKLRLKRMNLGEHSEFASRGNVLSTPKQARFTARGDTAEEQAKDQEGNFEIPLGDLAVRKIKALSTEKLAEYEAACKADEANSTEFLIYVFDSFVKVAAGLVEELEDGTEKSVTDGLDFLRLFGARNDVLSRVLEAVREENTLTAEEKKAWKSGIDSSPISTELDPVPIGPKLETTVENVKTEDTAELADAPSSRPGLHGSTETSSSAGVPSSS